MSDYPAEYETAVRYAADVSHSDRIAKALSPRDWRGGPLASQLHRNLLADALEAEGRHGEAGLLRHPNLKLYRDENGIHSVADLQRRHREQTSVFFPRLTDAERQYLETALWSSMDESDENTGGEPMDRNYDIQDIEPETVADMLADWRHFRYANADLMTKHDDDADYAHHFWTARNGHGIGFDDYPERYGEEEAAELQRRARRYGDYHLDVDHETGRIYGTDG